MGIWAHLFSQIDFERILNNLIVDIESNLDLDFVHENNVLWIKNCINPLLFSQSSSPIMQWLK